MDILGEIQDALAHQLDAVFAPVPIYFEEIPSTGDGEEPALPADYIYVDIIPAGMDTIAPHRTDLSVFVDIALHTAGEQNREYRRLAMEIDLLFRPVFRFTDRAITVHRANAKVVDRVLHYSFTLRFIPGVDVPVDDSLVLMETLAAKIEII